MVPTPTCKRGHDDANNYHVKASEDVPQSKKLRKKPTEKANVEQKEPLYDSIVETLSQPRFVPAKQMEIMSKLPYELLVEIAKRLKKFEDFTCLGSVSKPLHLLVEDKYFDGLRFRKSLPYLMLPPISRDDVIDDIGRQFYSLVEGESIVATSNVAALKTSKMCFESLGWLLTVDVDGIMSLLDPFSNTEILVPHLYTFPKLKFLIWDKRFLIKKMVLSSRPNHTSDFVMMVIIGDCSNMAYCRLGDKVWRKIDGPNKCVRDIVYGCGEQFYSIGPQGIIWAIDLAAGHVECRIIVKHGSALEVGPLQGQYILKTIDGSLLVIKRTRDRKFFQTNEFRAYDIDINTGVCTEIYSLGSMAVFLGRNSSIALDATAPNVGVLKANHIYFTDDFGDYQNHYFTGGNWRSYAYGSQYAKVGSVDSGVYNFETRDIKSIYPVVPLLSNVCPAMWITPNLPFI